MIDIINKIKDLLKKVFINETESFDVNNIKSIEDFLKEHFDIITQIKPVTNKYLEIFFFKQDYKGERGVSKKILEIIKCFEDCGYNVQREDNEYRLILYK